MWSFAASWGCQIPPAYEQSDAWSDVVCDDIDQLCAAAQEAHDAYQPLPSTIAAVTAALCGMPPELAAPLQACLRDTANCASFLTYIQGDCDFSVLNKRDKTRVTVGTHLYVFRSECECSQCSGCHCGFWFAAFASLIVLLLPVPVPCAVQAEGSGRRGLVGRFCKCWEGLRRARTDAVRGLQVQDTRLFTLRQP